MQTPKRRWSSEHAREDKEPPFDVKPVLEGLGKVTNGAGKTRPFTDAHAIVSVDLALGFDDPLSEDVFRELEGSLGTALVSEKFVKDESASEKNVGMHLAYERKSDDGEVMEFVHVHPDYIHAQVYEYRGWELTRDRLVEVLKPVLKIACSSATPAEALFLSFKDAFLNDESDGYSASDVFKPNDLLPNAVFKSSGYWVHRLSMNFAGDDGTKRWSNIYSRLGIDAGIKSMDDDNERHVTELTHRQGSFVAPGVDVETAFNEESVKLRLDVMHNRNREVMLELLNDEMCSRIGLEREVSK